MDTAATLAVAADIGAADKWATLPRSASRALTGTIARAATRRAPPIAIRMQATPMLGPRPPGLTTPIATRARPMPAPRLRGLATPIATRARPMPVPRPPGLLRQSQPEPVQCRCRGCGGWLRQSQPGHRPSRRGWRGRRGRLRQSQPGHRPSRSGWRGRGGRLRQSQPVRPVPPRYGVRQLRTLRLCRGHGWLWRLWRLGRLWLRQWRRSMGHGLTDVRLGLLKL